MLLPLGIGLPAEIVSRQLLVPNRTFLCGRSLLAGTAQKQDCWYDSQSAVKEKPVSKIYMTAAMALALAAAVPAYAQTAATHETRTMAANETLLHSIQPDEVRASK